MNVHYYYYCLGGVCVYETEQRSMSVCWQELIARLLSFYPQQAMWMMMAVSKVNNALFV